MSFLFDEILKIYDEEDIYSFNNEKSEEVKLKLSNRTRNKVKFDKEHKLKLRRKTIKHKTSNAMRSTINFNIFNQEKDNIRKVNKHLTRSFRKSALRYSSIFKKDKNLEIEKEKEKSLFKPKKIIIKDEKNNSKNYSSNKILKI